MTPELGELPWSELLERLVHDVGSRPRSRVTGADRLPPENAPQPQDNAAWAEFLRRLSNYGAMVRRWYPAVSTEEIEDWVQETAVQYSDEKRLRWLASQVRGHPSFFLQVLKRRAIDAGRQAGRQRRSSSALAHHLNTSVPPVDPIEERDAAAVSEDLESRLRTLIAGLPTSDQLLIRLRIREGKTLRDISQQLRSPYGTIASRWFRLMRLLERELGSGEGKEGEM